MKKHLPRLRQKRLARAFQALPLAAVIFATVMVGPGAAAPDTVITFENLAPGIVVTTNYAGLGVDFGHSPTQSSGAGEKLTIVDRPVGQTHSGTRAAAISYCNVEVCAGFRPIWAHFGLARHHVAAYLGGGYGAGTPVRMTAFDASGNAVASVTKLVGPPTLTPFEVNTASATIVFIQIAQVNTTEARAGISLDDLSFNSIGPGEAKPDFGIARDLSATFSPSGDVDMVKGKSTPVSIVVNRINGASGPLKFSVSGLPSGVSASFAPSSLTAAGKVTLNLTAAIGAPTWSSTVAVKADPLGNAQAGASPHSLSFPLHVLGNYDLTVVGIEVTQGVQGQLQQCTDKTSCSSTPSLPFVLPDGSSHTTDYNGVLLVKHAITVARVFGRVKSPQGQQVSGVTVALHGFRNGQELAGSPLISSQKQLANGWPWVTFLDRADPLKGWGFTLPDGWVQGNVTLKAEVIDPNQISLGPSVAECETQACKANNFFTLRNVLFVADTGHIKLSLVRLSTHPDNYFDRVEPFPKTVLNAAERVAPLAPGQLRYSSGYDGWIDISDLVTPFNDPDAIREQDSEIADRLEDWIDDNPACEKRTCADQTVGVYTNVGYGLSRGKLLEGDEPVSVVDSSDPLKSVAHELAHGWGRVHASYGCGGGSDGQVAEFWPPDEQGLIQGIGLDVRSGTGGDLGAPYRVIAPGALGAPPGIVGGGPESSQWLDFMSYCAGGSNNKPWISTKGWNQEVGLLQAIEILHAHPHELTAARRTASAGHTSTPSLRVHGFIARNGKAVITSVKPGGGRPIASATGSQYHLVVRGANGKLVSDTLMRMVVGHVFGHGNVAYVTGQGPAPQATSVQVVRGGVVLAARERSAHAPRVTVLAPGRGARVGVKRTVQIRWRATDLDRERLETRVDYSVDGRTFTPIFSGPDRQSVAMPSALLSASRRARLRIAVSDGFNRTVVVSAPFRAAGRPPRPRINTPLVRSRFSAAETIALAGDAYDDRGQRLRPASLRWLDGRHLLGRGRRLSVNGLLPGSRRIRLVARDRLGRTGSAQVVVRIAAVRPRFLVLRAPGRVSASANRVALGVSTNVPALLSIHGVRYRVGRRARTVRVTITPAHRLLQLRLVLRAGHLRTVTRLTIHR